MKANSLKISKVFSSGGDVMARHCRMMALELDFIINYDVQHRAGASALWEDGDE